jgi:hypothetical protein
MTRLVTVFFGAVVLGFAGVSLTPVVAEAQCHWGCRCEGNDCGCNRNGSGSSCDNGGTGCVVSGCGTELTHGTFAPDGSFATFASTSTDALSSDGEHASMETPASGGSYRWEFASPGYSVARHCSGVVLERYFDRATAAAVRERTRSFTI